MQGFSLPCSTTAMPTMPALYGCWVSWLGYARDLSPQGVRLRRLWLKD